MTTVAQGLFQAVGRVSRSEARLLLATTIRKPKEFLIAHPEYSLTDEEVSLFDSYLQRAQAGEPIPYIVGTQEFWGRPFHVTPATLIPRPDTETLIEEALAFLQNLEAPRILDLGTGSGCIAVTIALDCPKAQVWACDKSKDALNVAKGNAEAFGAKVTFVESNWFSAFADEKFDLIVSNPPYIEENDEHLKALRFEPISALTSGTDGLDDIRILAADAPKHLREHGSIIVEHGYNHTATIRENRSRQFSGQRALHPYEPCATSGIIRGFAAPCASVPFFERLRRPTPSSYERTSRKWKF